MKEEAINIFNNKMTQKLDKLANNFVESEHD
jgi:hypothetical protein